jgi:hypothetical protein
MEIGQSFKKSSGRMPLHHLESPVGASEDSPGQARRWMPSAPPWVSIAAHYSPLPLNRLAYGRLRGRGWERGAFDRTLNLPLRSSVYVWSARTMMYAKQHCQTLHPALSPQPKKRVGGEGKTVGTVTQGGARGSCLALALGYNPPPRWGPTWKKRPPAASQMSNLEHSRETGNPAL